MVQEAKTGSGSREAIGDGDRIVEQGECIFSIAFKAGHNWKTIWNHPQNRMLREKRGSPHVLLPGDRVFIPAIEPGRYPETTEKRHRFVLQGVPIHFEIEVYRDNKPRKGEPYVLQIEGRTQSGTIPGDGILRAKMMPGDQQGSLTIGSGPTAEEFKLVFGKLDPAHSKSGAAARLRHLGYLGNSEEDEDLADAVTRFQLENGLNESGELDDPTARQLAEKHGS